LYDFNKQSIIGTVDDEADESQGELVLKLLPYVPNELNMLLVAKLLP